MYILSKTAILKNSFITNIQKINEQMYLKFYFCNDLTQFINTSVLKKVTNDPYKTKIGIKEYKLFFSIISNNLLN